MTSADERPPGAADAARARAEAALAAAAGGPPFLARLGAAGVLQATGPDAAPFLHGQLANDVTGLGVGETNRSLLLNHKGHALAEAQVLRLEPQRFLLVVDDGRLAWAEESLRRHVVFDDVSLERSPSAVVTVQGERAAEAVAEALGAVPAGGSFVRAAPAGAEVVAYAARRSAAGGFDIVVMGGDGEALAAALLAAGAVDAGEEGLGAARVAARVPAAGREGGEGVLPQEAGLDVHVSFRKGCYLGQEIMARVAARGNVRRSLRTLALAGEPAGADVEAGGRVVGHLGTVARFPDGSLRALAVLRDELATGAEVSAGGVRATVVDEAARRMPP